MRFHPEPSLQFHPFHLARLGHSLHPFQPEILRPEGLEIEMVVGRMLGINLVGGFNPSEKY